MSFRKKNLSLVPDSPAMEKFSGYLVGYRIWRVKRVNEDNADSTKTNKTPVLASVYAKEYLSPDGQKNPHRASCNRFWTRKRKNHFPPESRCHCGYYIYNSLSYANKLAKSEKWYRGHQTVVGAVIGWGRIQLHAEGFRAEYMKVVALKNSSSNASLKPQNNLSQELAVLASSYNVPLVDDEHFEGFARSFGPVWGSSPELSFNFTAKQKFWRKLLDICFFIGGFNGPQKLQPFLCSAIIINFIGNDFFSDTLLGTLSAYPLLIWLVCFIFCLVMRRR